MVTYFSRSKSIQPMQLASAGSRTITLRVKGKLESRRWRIQRHLQKVGGRGAITGFTKTLITSGGKHRIQLLSSDARRLMKRLAPSIIRRHVAIWIDGRLVRLKKRNGEKV